MIRQLQICCKSCGREQQRAKGLCATCYERQRKDKGGARAQALERDHHSCRCCLSGQRLVLHKRPGNRRDAQAYITMCRRCMPLLRAAKLAMWMPPILKKLWREMHPGVPVQKELHISHKRVPRAVQTELYALP